MDFFNAFNESINQFSDLYNVPRETAAFLVPAIIIGGAVIMFAAGPISDALVNGSSW